MADRSKPAERWIAVDQYVTALLAPPDPALTAALDASARASLPAIQVSPPLGKLLQLLAGLVNARAILEIGTLGGYSAIWLARGLVSGGRLTTLEVDPRHAEVARKNLAEAGLADRVTIRLGPAEDSLAQLVAERHAPFDLVFIDADKTGYPAYLEWALRLSRPGTLIIADNVVRDGEVADPTSSDPNVQAVRRFTAQLAAEPRLSATVVQTVGAKGYDGFALAVVR